MARAFSSYSSYDGLRLCHTRTGRPPVRTPNLVGPARGRATRVMLSSGSARDSGTGLR